METETPKRVATFGILRQVGPEGAGKELTHAKERDTRYENTNEQPLPPSDPNPNFYSSKL